MKFISTTWMNRNAIEKTHQKIIGIKIHLSILELFWIPMTSVQEHTPRSLSATQLSDSSYNARGSIMIIAITKYIKTNGSTQTQPQLSSKQSKPVFVRNMPISKVGMFGRSTTANHNDYASNRAWQCRNRKLTCLRRTHSLLDAAPCLPVRWWCICG